MLAFRLARRKDNVNSESCPRSYTSRVTVSVCFLRVCGDDVIIITIIGIVIIAVALVPRNHWLCSLRNGKSNIFAYEMSEKSKHGGSQARAMANKKGTRRFPA